MNATEILWQAARVGEKRALPILSFPAAKALGIPVDEMARSAELQAKAVFHASRLPTAAAVSPMDLSIEAEAFGVTCGTEDKNEGMGAFLEKRAEKHFQNR